MTDKITDKKDFREIAQGFGVCTAAVLVMYLISGMNAVYLSEVPASLLMTFLTVCCAYYVTSVYISGPKRFLSLISALPAFGIYMAAFCFSFNASGRQMLLCLSAMESIMLWAGLGTVAVSVLILFAGHKLTVKDAVTAVLAAGFVLRAVMVLFTPLNFYQHDVSDFNPKDNCFHDGYILFIYNHMALPTGDVRDYGMFYHPPLHYLISALFFRIQNAIPFRFSGDINGLKMLPMLWTSYLVLFSKKIIEYFDLKGRALVYALLFIIISPQTIFLSIQVNNDALGLMLFVAAVFAALKWYSKPELTTILFLALAIGCAMMTKLSMGFVAFPVAWLFLVKLLKALKDRKDPKDRKAKSRLKELIKQFAAFAAVVFPLGLWFPLRNLIGYGTPITYVFELDASAEQDVRMFSIWQRLFVPSKELIEMPFLYAGGKINDYNIFLALLKTSLFDERRSMDPILTMAARILLTVGFILFLVIVICTVTGTYRRFVKNGKKIFSSPEKVALWILTAVLTGSEYVFCFKHPVACTQSFRYIAPVLIPAAFWCGSVIQMSDEEGAGKVLKICSWGIRITLILFVIAVLLFYGPFAQYSMPWEYLIYKSGS